MLFSRGDHPKFPPASWEVVKVAPGLWVLRVPGSTVLESFKTKRAAEAAKVSGPLVRLYEEDRAWYAGEERPGWKPAAGRL